MNVVVVDDDQINLLVTEAMVRSIGGCHAISFTNALEAFRWCCANPFDLLIVDYLMPLLNGIDFIARLRTDPKLAEVPMLMVTARSERAVLHRAFAAGATDFLTKPVDDIEFGARVSTCWPCTRAAPTAPVSRRPWPPKWMTRRLTP